MASNNKGLGVGCWVAMGITAFLTLSCGGLLVFFGWTVWTDPDVQRVVDAVARVGRGQYIRQQIAALGEDDDVDVCLGRRALA